MKEPQVPNYPNTPDDNTSLFGPLQNAKVLTVYSEIGVDSSTIQFNEADTMCSNIVAPFYAVFESGEIWFVQTGGWSKNVSGRWQISLDSTAEQRALHGSPLQPHMKNEHVYIGLISSHFNQMKRVVQAAQKFHFRVFDTEAARTAYYTTNPPVQGERCLVKETKKAYYCYTGSTMVWLNRMRHQDMTATSLGHNDHPQYIQSAAVTTFHNGLGGHILGGDNHDHTTANEGAAVGMLASGTYANLPSSPVAGQIFFATDVQGGTLYIYAQGQWDKVGGIPSGAIAMYDGACPTGWTRYTALDSRYPYGAATSGAVGGNNTHSHTYSTMIQHYHAIGGQAVSLSSGGSHSHTVSGRTAGSGNSGSNMTFYGGNTSWGVDSVGGHTHSVSIAARNTDSTGVGSPSTSSVSGEPLYQEVVFCKKD